MILGAGVYQVPLIQKARELGLETIVVSYPGPYPGLEMADKALLIDTTDARTVLDAARREKIDGITTTGTDVAVRTMGVVCDELGLPGLSERCARCLTDKAAMKEMFRRGGVPTSRFKVVSTLDEACEAASLLAFPVMVKACDVSGSRGITKVESESDMEAAYLAARRATHTAHIIVEKFVEGTEIGVDGFVVDGHMALFAPHTKFTLSVGGVTIPSGHAFPPQLSALARESSRDALARAIRASGLRTGAFNSDVIISPDESAYVLEMGARCGATGIPELITIHTGIDYYEQIIRASLGLSVSLETVPELIPCMSGLLFSDHDGTVRYIDEERLSDTASRFAATVSLDVKSGDRVHAAHDGTDRFGSVILPASHREELEMAVAEVLSCIDLTAESEI